MMRFVGLVLCIPAIAHADLPHDIEAALNNKLLAHAKTGICIVRLGDSVESSPIIYSHQPKLPLIPASNLKVVTTSATLDFLGPDFKFRTLLIRHGDDLLLLGDGDPSFGDSDYLKKTGWDSTTVFRNWADELKKKGVTKITNVIVDDSVFEEASFHPHWPPEQNVLKFSAEVGGLNLNANCVDFYFTFNGVGEPTGYRTAPETSYLTVTNRVIGGESNAIAPQRPIETLLRADPPEREREGQPALPRAEGVELDAVGDHRIVSQGRRRRAALGVGNELEQGSSTRGQRGGRVVIERQVQGRQRRRLPAGT